MAGKMAVRVFDPDNPPDTQNMSGDAYVSVLMRGDGPAKDRRGRVPLWHPSTCTHVWSICQVCAASWEYDYHLMLERTGGGRLLAEQLGRTLGAK
jgi:hypothetical protein